MSAIPYDRLHANLTAQKLINALLKAGFTLRRSKGAHRQYAHPDGRRVTITYHASSDTFPTKTLKRIIEEQAQWSEVDLKRLKLLK